MYSVPQQAPPSYYQKYDPQEANWGGQHWGPPPEQNGMKPEYHDSAESGHDYSQVAKQWRDKYWIILPIVALVAYVVGSVKELFFEVFPQPKVYTTGLFLGGSKSISNLFASLVGPVVSIVASHIIFLMNMKISVAGVKRSLILYQLGNIVLLFALMVVGGAAFLREPISSIGFNATNSRAGWIFIAVLLIIAAVVCFLVWPLSLMISEFLKGTRKILSRNFSGMFSCLMGKAVISALLLAIPAQIIMNLLSVRLIRRFLDLYKTSGTVPLSSLRIPSIPQDEESMGASLLFILPSAIYLSNLVSSVTRFTVSGFTASWLLLSKKIDNVYVLEKKNPISSTLTLGLTTSLGTLSVFSLVDLMLSALKLLVNSATNTNSDDNVGSWLFKYIARMVLGVILLIVEAVCSYSLVLHSIYGEKFSTTISRAYNRVSSIKGFRILILNIPISYYFQSSSLFVTLLSLLSHLLANTPIIKSSAMGGRYETVCSYAMDTSQKYFSNESSQIIIQGSCMALATAKLLMFPIIFTVTFSMLYINLYEEIVNSLIACHVEDTNSNLKISPILKNQLDQALQTRTETAFNHGQI